jgi:hypothetical protein
LASEIGRRHGLKLEKDERDRDSLTGGGRPFLSRLKAEFSDLDWRLSIMDHQVVHTGFGWIFAIEHLQGRVNKASLRCNNPTAQWPLEYLVRNFGTADVLLGAIMPVTWATPSHSGHCADPIVNK